MPSYRLTPEAESILRRRTVTTAIPLGLLVVAVGVGVSMTQGGGSMDGLWLVLPILVAVLAIGVYRGYRRQRLQLRSLEITTGPDFLTRTMAGVPPLTLHREEVERISEHVSGELTINVGDRLRSMRVPAQVERRGDLLEELSRWTTVEPAGKVHTQRWSGGAALATLLAFAVTMMSTNAVVVAVVGSALVLTLLASAVLIWRNRQLDAKTRRLAFVVPLPAAAILVHVIAVLRGA